MTHAIRFHRTGGPEVLVWEEVQVGKPGPGEARIRHTAVGLNFIDIYNRSGLYPAQLPSGLGGEGAGVVEEVGSGVTDLKPGDRVAYGAAPIGAYAEARLIPADRLLKLPDSIDDKTAAAMMLKGLTVAVSYPPDLSRQSRRYHPAACGGRRRRPDPVAMGEASRRDRHRHRRQRREGEARQGPRLRPHHRLHAGRISSSASTRSPAARRCLWSMTPSARTRS